MENANQLCKTCNTKLQGDYCYNCGEKRVEEKDFSIKSILTQGFDAFFNLDSKIFKSFYFLLLKPGRLTVNYVNGVRKPYMKPFQIFLIVNVLFFILLADADVLRIPAEYYFQTSERLKDLSNLSVETGISGPELQQMYNAKSSDFSKGFVFILIPLAAIGFYLLNLKKKFLIGKHVIFSIHYFSFFLIFCVVLLLVPINKSPLVIQSVIISFNFIYLTLAIKTFYRDVLWKAVIKGLIATAFCMFLAVQYRRIISDIAFYFTA